jgi:hypothetical protein
MNFGSLSGLVNGTETVVFDRTVTGSAVSSIATGNILNGDEDGWYTIIFRHIYDGANVAAFLRFNGDSGTNYGYRSTNANNTTVANYNNTGNTGTYISSVTSTGTSSIGVAKV